MAILKTFLGKQVEIPEDLRYQIKQGLWAKKSDKSIFFGLTQPALVLTGGFKDIEALVGDETIVKPGDSVIFAITAKILYLVIGSLSLITGFLSGLLGGMVGQGGSFILIPLMSSYVKVPTRIAIGSNLGIVMLSSLAAFLSKAATGQIQWLMTIPIVLTVIPFSALGGYVSSKVPVLWLRKILACLIAVAALRMWFSLLF